MPRYNVGDKVLRRNGDGWRSARIVEVLRAAPGRPAVYRVRVGMISHLVDEDDLRPATPPTV